MSLYIRFAVLGYLVASILGAAVSVSDDGTVAVASGPCAVDAVDQDCVNSPHKQSEQNEGCSIAAPPNSIIYIGDGEELSTSAQLFKNTFSVDSKIIRRRSSLDGKKTKTGTVEWMPTGDESLSAWRLCFRSTRSRKDWAAWKIVLCTATCVVCAICTCFKLAMDGDEKAQRHEVQAVASIALGSIANTADGVGFAPGYDDDGKTGSMKALHGGDNFEKLMAGRESSCGNYIMYIGCCCGPLTSRRSKVVVAALTIGFVGLASMAKSDPLSSEDLYLPGVGYDSSECWARHESLNTESEYIRHYSCNDPVCNLRLKCTDRTWSLELRQQMENCACPIDKTTLDRYEGQLVVKAPAVPINMYAHHVPGVGHWGGECTCPDGQTYQVGDNSDSCGSLACHYGTITKPCMNTDGIISNFSYSGNQVVCATPDLAGRGTAKQSNINQGDAPLDFDFGSGSGSGSDSDTGFHLRLNYGRPYTLGIADLNWKNISWMPLYNVQLSFAEPLLSNGNVSNLTFLPRIRGNVAVVHITRYGGSVFGAVARQAQELGAAAVLLISRDPVKMLRMGDGAGYFYDNHHEERRYWDNGGKWKACEDHKSCVDAEMVSIPVYRIGETEGLALHNAIATQSNPNIRVDLNRHQTQRANLRINFWPAFHYWASTLLCAGFGMAGIVAILSYQFMKRRAGPKLWDSSIEPHFGGDVNGEESDNFWNSLTSGRHSACCCLGLCQCLHSNIGTHPTRKELWHAAKDKSISDTDAVQIANRVLGRSKSQRVLDYETKLYADNRCGNCRDSLVFCATLECLAAPSFCCCQTDTSAVCTDSSNSVQGQERGDDPICLDFNYLNPGCFDKCNWRKQNKTMLKHPTTAFELACSNEKTELATRLFDAGSNIWRRSKLDRLKGGIVHVIAQNGNRLLFKKIADRVQAQNQEYAYSPHSMVSTTPNKLEETIYIQRQPFSHTTAESLKYCRLDKVVDKANSSVKKTFGYVRDDATFEARRQANIRAESSIHPLPAYKSYDEILDKNTIRTWLMFHGDRGWYPLTAPTATIVLSVPLDVDLESLKPAALNTLKNDLLKFVAAEGGFDADDVEYVDLWQHGELISGRERRNGDIEVRIIFTKEAANSDVAEKAESTIEEGIQKETTSTFSATINGEVKSAQITSVSVPTSTPAPSPLPAPTPVESTQAFINAKDRATAKPNASMSLNLKNTANATKTAADGNGAEKLSGIPNFRKIHWLDFRDNAGKTPIEVARDEGHSKLADEMTFVREPGLTEKLARDATADQIVIVTEVALQAIKYHIKDHGGGLLAIASRTICMNVQKASRDGSAADKIAKLVALQMNTALDNADTQGFAILPERLRPTKQFLLDYVQVPLYFHTCICVNPNRCDCVKGVPSIFRKSIFDPLVGIIRKRYIVLVEQVRIDPEWYIGWVADKAIPDAKAYDGMREKAMWGVGKQQYTAMIETIKRTHTNYIATNDAVRITQPTKDALELTLLLREATPLFQSIMAAIGSALNGSTTDRDRDVFVKITHRPMCKGLYRIIEKCLLKSAKHDTLNAAIDCSKLKDIAGCLISCPTFERMQEVMEALYAEKAWSVCELKCTWEGLSKAGWRDYKVIVKFKGLLFEIQVAIVIMMKARDYLDGHAAYEEFRNIYECVKYIGGYEEQLDDAVNPDLSRRGRRSVEFEVPSTITAVTSDDFASSLTVAAQGPTTLLAGMSDQLQALQQTASVLENERMQDHISALQTYVAGLQSPDNPKVVHETEC